MRTIHKDGNPPNKFKPRTDQLPESLAEIVNLSEEGPILPGVELEGDHDPNRLLKAATQRTEVTDDYMSSTSVSSEYANRPKGDHKKLADGWVSQDMPSKMVPYSDVSVMLLRPLTVPVLARVHSAQNAKSFPLILDALQPCVDMDIRDLTVPDFYFILYWLRLNSYPNSPMPLEWTSKYGNKNVTKIKQSDLEIKELEMTKAEYMEWEERGFCFPTVRDTEVLASDLPDDKQWMAQFAQYIKVEGPVTEDYMHRKVKALERMGVGIISQVKEFAEKLEHGIIEQVTVVDQHFDLDKAIVAMEREIENLTKLVEATVKGDGESDLSGIAAIARHVDVRRMELDKLIKAKENGETVEPDKEVVALGVADATILFPS